jgi:hypothetical protein
VPLEEKELLDKYPLAFNFISNFKKELEIKKTKYKTNPKFWYSLHRSREIKLFHSEKIITPQLQNKSSFTIDTNNFFPDAGGYMIIKKENDLTNLKAYLAVFNSKLFYYFIQQTSTPYNNNYYYFKTNYIEPFSIPQITYESQKTFIDLVDKILLGKINGENTIVWENEIDLRVYKLYELTHAEVLVIDPAFGMSEEEYELLAY